MKSLNTKWEEFSKEIKDMQSPETFSILWATDVHYIRKYAKYIPAYYKIEDMVEFSRCAGFDLLAITGDIVDGNTALTRQKKRFIYIYDRKYYLYITAYIRNIEYFIYEILLWNVYF